jgi:toxic protein SymE
MGLYIFGCRVPFFVVRSGITQQIISEEIAMAGRKEYRDLTVGDIYRNGKSVPMLRVSGLWLEELGFKTGDFVRIKCEDGQLIITLNEEKAQQKAEEEAFMAEEMKKLQKRYQKEKEEIHARFVAERKVGYGV